MVFAEGGTSNGTCLLPFKRGAFQSMKAITPIFIKYKYGTMSQCYDIVPFFPLLMMNLCLIDFAFEVVQLPPFLPNDYLFQKHSDKFQSAPSAPALESTRVKVESPTSPSPKADK